MKLQISKDLIDVLKLHVRLVNTPETSEEQKLSTELLDKAAEEFKFLFLQHNEWVRNSDISLIFKDAPYNTGKFIIEKFGFTNYFIRGRTTYFNRKDLLSLRSELKKRNIDLVQYILIKEDQGRLLKCVENSQKRIKKGKHYKLPDGLKDIIPIANELPPIELVQEKIESLRKVFKEEKLYYYINFYQDSTYAMYKYDLTPNYCLSDDKKAKCKKWCKEFNYANHVLNMIQRQSKLSC